jgi:hypothetical protein
MADTEPPDRVVAGLADALAGLDCMWDQNMRTIASLRGR